MAKNITLAAQLIGVKSRSDKTWKLEFNSQELGGGAAELLDLLMSQGWLLFSPNDDITEQDIPEVEADADLGGKSPSRRLRDVLWVFWKQKGQPGTWEVFYTTQMDRLIERVKNQLEPE